MNFCCWLCWTGERPRLGHRYRRGVDSQLLWPAEDGNSDIDAAGCGKKGYDRARLSQSIVDSAAAESFNCCPPRQA